MWRFLSAADVGGPLLTSLNGNQGRQTWVWDAAAGTPEQRSAADAARAAFTANRHVQRHSGDELLRLQAAERVAAKAHAPPPAGQRVAEGEVPTAPAVEAHLKGALAFYECLQADDGHFPGDYGGPMFLMPGLVIALYTCGVLGDVLRPEAQAEMVRYLYNHQNPDGGFGLHIEGTSTMFGTALSYVTLRLLGEDAERAEVVAARKWIHARGGATHITSWGKFWLSVLGVYSWDGQNPLSPEMWLLPYSAATGVGWLHPGRFWCHCRMVYLPMSYVYGVRGTCKETPLTAAIRGELYPVPYGSIDWNAARSQIAKEDLYYPHPLVQDVLWWALYKAEAVLLGSRLRRWALKEVMAHVHYEDANTRYIDIGPVNKVINMLACWLEDPNSDAFKRHLPRVYDYLWVAEDGMKMQGYNGSQLWDTSFAAQAMLDCGLPDVAGAALAKAHAYIEASQVVTEAEAPLGKFYRHISKGAWPFSTRDHGWPISDCTSEGFKAALGLAALGRPGVVGPAISVERLGEAVRVILSYQNSDGGMATYENTRSFHWLEVLNPAETFGDIIVDYSYVECTSACVTALTAFQRLHPGTSWAPKIAAALDRAEAFVRRVQRPDGSWYGSWGVCFTYGTWFGVTALAARGHSAGSDPAVRRACEFLVSKQRLDGGWGESYLSCQDKVYSQLEGDSHVVNTAWAMMALLAGGYHAADAKPLHRAAAYLMRAQCDSGDWPQQHISGVFNRNCMITYANYRNIFPIWALGLYRRLVLLGEARDSGPAGAPAGAPGRAWLCAVSDFYAPAGAGAPRE
ncbi:GgCAS1 [Scenedesmus sp. PABB004]|nr:GgCAS1 [Scenedesmus sp. PABB004]